MPKGELLPCPFCGGEARYEEVPSALGVAWSVGCCADETDCAGYQLMTSWATQRDAAAAWNRRSDRAEARKAALEEAEKALEARIEEVLAAMDENGDGINDRDNPRSVALLTLNLAQQDIRSLIGTDPATDREEG